MQACRPDAQVERTCAGGDGQSRPIAWEVLMLNSFSSIAIYAACICDVVTIRDAHVLSFC